MEQYSEKVMQHFQNPHNVGEIPDADGVGTVGNPVCVAPETMIFTNPDVKEIRDVKEGMCVLSHDGRYHFVEAASRRLYRGKIYSVTVNNLGKTVVTGDHHILAARMHNELYKMRSQHKYISDWCLTKELKKGDVILYPLPQDTQDIEYVNFDIGRPALDYKSKALPNKIKVDEDFLLLAGYYLSEGYVRTDKCKGTVGFAFGAKEKDYINETISLMRKVFGLSPAGLISNKNKTAIDIPFYSARLARFFEKHFGKGAINKHLPHWMMLLPKEKQESILCGLFRGDGYTDRKRQRAKYVTISKGLAYQIRTLLLRQKIITSFSIAKKSGMHNESYLLYIQDDSSLKKISEITGIRIDIKARRKNIHKSWFDDKFYYTTIRKIEPLRYNNLVYNLEVEGAHSYVSNALTLHNCGDVMKLYLKLKDGIISDAKFKTFGCGAAVATSSMVTDLVKGKTIEEALAISNRAVAEALGGLPPIKMHCSVLAEQALRAAIDDFYKRQGKITNYSSKISPHDEHGHKH